MNRFFRSLHNLSANAPFAAAIGATILGLTFVSSEVFAKGAAAAPASGKAANAAPLAPLGSGGNVAPVVLGGPAIAPVSASPLLTAGTGLGNGNLYAPFVPGSIMPGAMPINPANPYADMPLVYNPPPNPYGFVSACFAASQGLLGAQGTMALAEAARARDIADFANDHAPWTLPNGVSASQGRRYGHDLMRVFGPNERGCEKFVDKEGKIGPWGRKALEQMHSSESLKNIYETKVPPDMDKFCPEFKNMDQNRKDYFWLWFFASLSKPESTCQSGAVNPNAPNGNAIGLFQLEANKCIPLGINVSSQELLNPDRNIECAVSRFGKEMAERGTIQIGYSNRKGGTYWGELRTNPYGSGDSRAAAQTQNLLQHWPDCQKNNESSTLPQISGAKAD